MHAVSRRVVPDPVDDELPRPQLIRRLQERFHARVVAVVAGAGFGKSTAVAQAVRHNLAHPLGLEVWLTCRPGHEDAERFGADLLAQLGGERGARGERGGATPGSTSVAALAAAVERAITDVSPLDMCLVIDDVHLLSPGSSSERLLGDIVRRLPDNGHLVLLSRHTPAVPLARLRAAGLVVDLDERDLAFSDTEVAALAVSAGRSADQVRGLGGWPALVRLGLAAPVGADRDFLVEEVLAALDDDRRTTLLALALAGPADDATVSRVVGRPVGVADELRGVPLVSRTSDGRHDAHQLWDDALRSSFDPAVLRSLQLRAVDALIEHDQAAKAAQVALSMGDLATLDRVALATVRAHLNHVPVDTVVPWLEAAEHPGPALRVLDGLVRYTTDVRDLSADAVVGEVIDEARERGDLDLEAAAIGAASVMAHARQDLGRLLPLALRASEMPPSSDPVLALLRAGVPAVGADLDGDPEAVIEAVRDVPWARAPLGGTRLLGRLHLQALWMAGRARDSIAFADTWFHGTESFLGGLPAIARWFAGDPSEAFASGIGIDRTDATNDRDAFVGNCFLTMIGASRGRRDDVESIWADGTIAALAFDNARDSAHLTYATAARHVLAGDDAAAAAVYRDHLQRFGVDDRLGERHLRRFPALGYVLSPELRARWDQVPLGPDHDSARTSARALLTVRDGRTPGPLPDVAAVVTHLPLPWTVELIAGLVEHDDPRADAIWRDVASLVGPAATDELGRRAALGSRHLPGAAALLARLPNTPGMVTSIRVLGPLSVLHDGVASAAPEMRRQRVRQLLELLVLERAVTRDRAMALLWPELAPEAASKNLRVTLTHLRKVLEPDRPAGTAGYHVRVDHSSIALHPSDHLHVDAWEADERAWQLDRSNELVAERDALSRIVGLWRGVPYPDLDELVDLTGTLERVRGRHVGLLLRLGELYISAGNAAEAKRLALDVLAVDPYREQAHRLAIAADLRLDDAAELRRSVARLSQAMDELGVEASASTQVLLHRVTRRVGQDARRPPAFGEDLTP